MLVFNDANTLLVFNTKDLTKEKFKLDDSQQKFLKLNNYINSL